MTILTGDFAIHTGIAEHRAQVQGQTCAQDDLSEDARLYLRHVDQGVTIRALAREAGVHASTILRRIRRFEARRDDPLVDAALAPRPEGANAPDERQALRVLRRLAEPGACMASAPGMDKAIVTRDDIRTAVLERALAEMMALKGWVVQTRGGGRIQRYVIAPAGREALRQMLRSPRQRSAVPGPSSFADAHPVHKDAQPVYGMAEAQAAFDHGDRHRVWEDRVIDDPEDGRRRQTRVNIAESPLLVRARRRDHDGQAFLTPGMVTAGERLREDFELAQMGPRVTQNWTG